MRTLITLIIGIIIGAAGLFYGMKNGMVKLDMSATPVKEEAAAAPHAQAEPVAPKAAVVAAAVSAQAEPAQVEESEDDAF